MAGVPPRLLWLLPAGAKVAGRALHSLENSALHGAQHINIIYSTHEKVSFDNIVIQAHFLNIPTIIVLLMRAMS
jgi:hypothetical protein